MYVKKKPILWVLCHRLLSTNEKKTAKMSTKRLKRNAKCLNKEKADCKNVWKAKKWQKNVYKKKNRNAKTSKKKKKTAKMSTKKNDCKPESVQMWKEDFILCGAANILLSSFCLRNWPFCRYFYAMCMHSQFCKQVSTFKGMKKGTFLFKFYLTYFINTCNTALFNFPSFWNNNYLFVKTEPSVKHWKLLKSLKRNIFFLLISFIPSP